VFVVARHVLFVRREEITMNRNGKRKLTLTRETIKALDGFDLDQVNGGAAPPPNSGGGGGGGASKMSTVSMSASVTAGPPCVPFSVTLPICSQGPSL
jgi:hypothetical protein